MDVSLPKGEHIALPTRPEDTVFAFCIQGEAIISAQLIAEKTAILFGAGDGVSIEATPDRDLRFILFSAKPLHEPVAWGGPIVMNTREELDRAFAELRDGTFIQTEPIL
ncbi:hypothetical protein SDC9_134966 [bioreactor metagenome]|uniref:Pirin C-terminal domain-containing protein n=1 Tax=bioreactor metagenome TaxID=1076179 RepID=A0A645DEU3_9ZZZZ